MKPIKEVIEEKYSREYFQKMGRKWWDKLTPEEQAERKARLREASKRGGESTKNKYSEFAESFDSEVKTHSQKVMESQRRYPEKHSARVAVRRAVISGKMKKASELKCIDCGNDAKEYDHSHGYEKENWLKVDAVCVKCHKIRGVKRGEYRS